MSNHIGGLGMPLLLYGLLTSFLTLCGCEDNCEDGLDNDGDGLSDCADYECFGRGPLCTVERDCRDGWDNDLDGEIDCDDLDCESTSDCTMEWSCYDDLDNDNDGLIDCEDPDCADLSYCIERYCANSRDDDDDGLVDCDDPDCFSTNECRYWERDCANGVDDDHDGDIDCADEDCALWACNIEGELCDDGLDNEGDGLIDCDDPECEDRPVCCVPQPERCEGGVDEDCDGRVDCLDDDCQGHWSCALIPGLFERFTDEEGTPDIIGLELQFSPDPSLTTGYALEVLAMGEGFRIAPGTGNLSESVTLDDDDFIGYPLTLLSAVELFGVRYDRLYVSSNGYVTFGEGSANRGSHAEAHFALPGVAVFRGNLDPSLSGGAITVDEFPETVVVTWEGVRAVGSSPRATMQLVLDERGRVSVSSLSLPEIDGLVGLSAGMGEGGQLPPESDLVP